MSEDNLPLLWIFLVLLTAKLTYPSPTLHYLSGDYKLYPISDTEYRMHIMENALASGDKGLGGPIDRDFTKKRFDAFQTIQETIQTYFLDAAMEDFFNEVNKVASAKKFEFNQQDGNTFGNESCQECSQEKLEDLLEVYLTLLEKYPELHSDPNLENHLITHYDKAKEYVRKKVLKFKSDLARVRNSEFFQTRKEYYEKKEKIVGMMSILYKWCDSLITTGTDGEVKKELFNHLNRAKRFWLLKALRSL